MVRTLLLLYVSHTTITVLAGCMVVELLDYRPPKGKDPVLEKPEKTRVVLTPNQETFWTDLCLLNQKAGSAWTDRDALEVEARILVCFVRWILQS